MTKKGTTAIYQTTSARALRRLLLRLRVRRRRRLRRWQVVLEHGRVQLPLDDDLSLPAKALEQRRLEDESRPRRLDALVAVRLDVDLSKCNKWTRHVTHTHPRQSRSSRPRYGSVPWPLES